MPPWSPSRRHLLAASSAALWARAARAQPVQAWPLREVHYVVPYAPGGPAGAVAQLIAPQLAQRWGQPVAVEHRPGANGSLAAGHVAQSAPDGYVLLQGTSSTQGTNPLLFRHLPYDAARDFSPVAGLMEAPMYLCVHPASPFARVQELLAHARSHPGALRVATAGPGSPQHLAGVLLGHVARVRLTTVHFRGAAPALAAMDRGEVDLYFDSTGAAHARAGRLRVLGVTSASRWPLALDVPTLAESGLRGLDLQGWFGLFAPHGTSSDLLDRINGDVNAVLGMHAVRTGLVELGLRPLGGSARALADRIRRESAHWAAIVRAQKLAVD